MSIRCDTFSHPRRALKECCKHCIWSPWIGRSGDSIIICGPQLEYDSLWDPTVRIVVSVCRTRDSKRGYIDTNWSGLGSRRQLPRRKVEHSVSTTTPFLSNEITSIQRSKNRPSAIPRKSNVSLLFCKLLMTTGGHLFGFPQLRTCQCSRTMGGISW